MMVVYVNILTLILFVSLDSNIKMFLAQKIKLTLRMTMKPTKLIASKKSSKTFAKIK